MTVELRAATDADRSFLQTLYARSRALELDGTGWNQSAKDAFFAQQFEAQDRDYRQRFPNASFGLVVINGAQAGRLIVDHSDEAVHVVDILLDVAYRGAGFGTVLLVRVIDDADHLGIPVTLYVDANNPARSWYERFGFRAISGDREGVSVRYRHAPAGDGARQANTAS